MGKKSSASTIPSASGSSSKKATKPAKSSTSTSNSNSTSIDDIFAAPKKRKAEEPISQGKKKSKNAQPTKEKTKSKSTASEPEKKKSKSASEKNGSSKKSKVVEPEEEEDDSEFDDEGFDDLDSDDFDDTEEEDDEEDESESEPPKRKVEEIIDPSSLAEIRRKIEAAKTAKMKMKVGGKKSDKDREDDAMFADSRGVGTGRKTEEGYIIYKEAELKIDPTAGGTPLCPFDCECCF